MATPKKPAGGSAVKTKTPEKIAASQVKSVLDAAGGIFRLAPAWVPRAFLMPGRRIKLHPADLYAYGADRGGIDERWFSSTTAAANPGANWDEGMSYIVHDGKKAFTLATAINHDGDSLIGPSIWSKYERWPVYSKFFDNAGPIPHHMHQSAEQAALVGQQGKPESYYFPPQLNPMGNNFPYTFMGLEPGTQKKDVRKCLERWNEGDNGILDFSKAYRLKPGTGWLIPPCVLHAPGSLVTYEPQWGSDVFGMYQSMVEGRYVPWELLVKDVPKKYHNDLDYLVDQLDWAANVDPTFKDTNYLEPIVAAGGPKDGYVDKWIVYGKVKGEELFSAKELTVSPGTKITIKDNGAYGLIAVQGCGTINGKTLQTPAMIRFKELTEDEYFVSHAAATAGVTYDNTGTEDLVVLRYFGPGVNPNAPKIGSYKS